MFISHDKVSLRIAEPEDADQIYAWENDRRIWRVSDTSAPTSLFQIEQFLLSNSDLTSNRQLRLMIELSDEPHPVGSVDLFDYDPIHERIGVGILIDEAHRQKGIAKKAIGLVVEYLFTDLMVHQIHCLIDETNIESQKLFEGLGFQCGGRRKDWIKTPEGFIDALFYQLINNHNKDL